MGCAPYIRLKQRMGHHLRYQCYVLLSAQSSAYTKGQVLIVWFW